MVIKQQTGAEWQQKRQEKQTTGEMMRKTNVLSATVMKKIG